MSIDLLAPALAEIRGADINSLLRMYDRARELATSAPRQLERKRAHKALQRIEAELHKRNVALEPCLSV